MLRGLTVVVAGIASLAGAASIGPEHVLGLEHSAAFVPVPGAGAELEIVRVDVLPTNDLCNASRVQLFSQPLTERTSFQEELDGTASIRLPNHAALTLTHWSMQCNPEWGSLEAHLETDTGDGDSWSMTVILDHTKVTHVIADGSEPWTFFEKTGGQWDSILTIDEEIVRGFSEDEVEDWKVWIPAQLSLPEQNLAEDTVDARKGASEQSMQLKNKKEGEKKCSGWRCLLHGVVEDVQSKASHLYTLRPRPTTQKPVSTMTLAELPTKMMRPLTTTRAASPTPSSARFIPAPEQDLLMTMSIAALAFTIFSFLGIAVLGARRYVSSDIQRLPYHRESCEERLARVANRRRAFKGFLQKLFCGVFGLAEKESSTPQGRDLRTAGEEQQTTLEADIAGFREAADMVESLVAIEEGRGRASFDDRRRPHWEEDDAPPPSYESDTAEGSMVADGFRYTPGGNGYPQTTPQTSSDRLGYWAK
ncbi:uncharacterized protein F5Z01DRAFT_650212 [Emericellopsis atlantica]|uniref:Uncharacterized protein n=1 Tax=Emericellopsis atlantica TaxID=2614577 RepID=A0A9P7ZRG9_9HYPO|nr:uncharacterized protein F5Z01DRAFT_650212 [Emericellopsis atlantica]KAG9256457.1 hypothetical protein F5Z01DRAFT_650212 [Emericellopsis atlantica]